MDSLAEMIRRGIEAANKDLKRENDARLMHEVMLFMQHIRALSIISITCEKQQNRTNIQCKFSARSPILASDDQKPITYESLILIRLIWFLMVE